MSSEPLTYRNIDRRTRINVMTGLMLAMLIACFDGTIAGTIAPKICETLSHSELYAWLVTVYLLCEAVMIPVSAKLSDLYGRKALYTVYGIGQIVSLYEARGICLYTHRFS